MINHFSLHYFDRPSGQVETERVVAAGFLNWSFNTRVGRWCTRALLSRRWVSRLLGCFTRSALSRRLIGPLVRFGAIPMSDFIRPGRGFDNFEQFFTRRLRPGARPLAGDEHVCTSPADARVLVIDGLEPERPLRIKRSLFDLRRLVTSAQLAGRYAGGTALICRLGLTDYHHVHFPVSGTAGPARSVDGRLYACGPYASRWLVPFYADNHRVITLVDSDHFGQVAVIEIGAFTVGSIRQQYDAGRHVCRGEPKAVFAPGGSTVVLLFEPGALQVDADLQHQSARELETHVRCGDSIGRSGVRRPRTNAREVAP